MTGERLSIPEIYRRSLKPRDLRFNNWVCRPLAAVFVYLLRPTPLTPNQITFLSLFVALGADAALLFWTDRAGAIAAAIGVYLAFVLDCTDGQLARIRGQTSTVGSYLDFLMDEIKAVALIAALAGRLARLGAPPPFTWDGPFAESHAFWLLVGLIGVVTAASGISLTTFMRRPEYFEAVTGRKAAQVPGFTALQDAEAPASAPAAAGSPLRTLIKLPIRLLEAAGKLILHYPAWLYIPVVFERCDLFLLPYLAAHLLYLGRSGLIVLWRLAR